MCARAQCRAIGSDARSGQRRRAGTVGSLYAEATVTIIITAVVRCCLIWRPVCASSIHVLDPGIGARHLACLSSHLITSTGVEVADEILISTSPHTRGCRRRALSHVGVAVACSVHGRVCVQCGLGVGCSHFPKACRGRSISFQEHASFQERGSSSSESAKPRQPAAEAAAAVSSPYEQGRAGQRGDVLRPPAEPNATPPARRTRRRRARAEGVMRHTQVAGAPERTAWPSDHRRERRSRVVRAVRAGWVTNYRGTATWGCARAWSL